MNIRKLLTRLVSLALIAVFLPTVAMADTWYLEDGSITVSATDSGQNVSQGGVTKEDSAPRHPEPGFFRFHHQQCHHQGGRGGDGQRDPGGHQHRHHRAAQGRRVQATRR